MSHFTLKLLIALMGLASCAAVLSLTGCQSLKTGTATNISRPASPELPEVATVKLSLHRLITQMRIPGELIAFRDVLIYPKVQGFIKAMRVDRGSVVKQGQVMVEIVAPEIDAQYGEAEGKLEAARSAFLEAESKLQSFLAQQKEAEFKLTADDAIYKRIQHAARTPGAIAPKDLEEAREKVQGDRAHVKSAEEIVEAAKAQLKSEKGKVKASEQALASFREMKAYLTVRAPFDGVITERNVHEGSLVSSTASSRPMLRLEQTSLLRLLVPVPESAISGVHLGSIMKFTVPAYTGKVFSGTVKRIGHALDIKTRTMPVEADVLNPQGQLEPGMYPEVYWTMERPYLTLFAPSSAVGSVAGRTFVVRIKDGTAEQIEVTRGQAMGDLVELSADLQPGDAVALNAQEELKSGTRVRAHPASDIEVKKSPQ